jgi:hypothetical protein
MVDAEALRTASMAAGIEAQLMPQVGPALYLVLITDLPNLAAAEKKAAELKRFGVEQQETVALDGGRQEIVLGRFPATPRRANFLPGSTSAASSRPVSMPATRHRSRPASNCADRRPACCSNCRA